LFELVARLFYSSILFGRVGKEFQIVLMTFISDVTRTSYFRQFQIQQQYFDTVHTTTTYCSSSQPQAETAPREPNKMNANEQLRFLTSPGGNGPVVISIGVLVPTGAALPPEITSTSTTATTCDKDTDSRRRKQQW
jgi:hypothetical protein